jgi:hypothetical protein
MSQILFEHKNLTIIFYEDKNYLFLKWNGFIPGGEFKALAREVLTAIDNKGRLNTIRQHKLERDQSK